MKQRKKQANSLCVFQRVEGQGCSRTLLALCCHGVRALRAGMGRRREMFMEEVAENLRVRQICNVARSVVK